VSRLWKRASFSSCSDREFDSPQTVDAAPGHELPVVLDTDAWHADRTVTKQLSHVWGAFGRESS